jgi:hypothetical protein
MHFTTHLFLELWRNADISGLGHRELAETSNSFARRSCPILRSRSMTVLVCLVGGVILLVRQKRY